MPLSLSPLPTPQIAQENTYPPPVPPQAFSSEQCPEGFVAVSKGALRILAVENAGEAFSAVATRLRYTPRRLLQHPGEPEVMVVVESDHAAVPLADREDLKERLQVGRGLWTWRVSVHSKLGHLGGGAAHASPSPNPTPPRPQNANRPARPPQASADAAAAADGDAADSAVAAAAARGPEFDDAVAAEEEQFGPPIGQPGEPRAGG